MVPAGPEELQLLGVQFPAQRPLVWKHPFELVSGPAPDFFLHLTCRHVRLTRLAPSQNEEFVVAQGLEGCLTSQLSSGGHGAFQEPELILGLPQAVSQRDAHVTFNSFICFSWFSSSASRRATSCVSIDLRPNSSTFVMCSAWPVVRRPSANP